MLVHLSRHLRPTTRKPVVCDIAKGFNTWALAIRNAASFPYKALRLYAQMHRQSVPFDSFSVLFTLKSCARLQNLRITSHLHSHLIKLGFSAHVHVATCLLNVYVVLSFDDASLLFDEMPERNTVTWNTMISGCSRLGDVNKARALFEEMPLKDLTSWSAIVTAYINNGFLDQGLLLFREMMMDGRLKPDQVILGSVLTGCARMGSRGLLVGKSVHGFVVKNGWKVNVKFGSFLVDMYAKCGFFKSACWVFELMPERGVLSWTALICGAAQHGFTQETLTLFNMMQETGVRPNEVTFTGVLNACAQMGLVEEGRKYFNMIKEHGLEPRIQHFGCMVDLFGRAGLLDEAYEVIKSMKFKPNIIVWGSFLLACKEYKQYDMAESVMEQVLREIEPKNNRGFYTQIWELYRLNGKWDDVEWLRKLLLKQHGEKTCGLSDGMDGIHVSSDNS
uniref:Pentatricopeptide repeat-containing protein n=1 Tax=Rhizophora mucronata TaxID=61149 RepID=A0A2P2IM29_RHIMU